MDAKKRQKLRTRNLQAIGNILPPLADALKRHNPLSKLVFDDDAEDGGGDVTVNGVPVYGGRARDFAAEKVEKFHRGGLRIVMPKPEPGMFDEHTNGFLQALDQRTAEEGIRFRDTPEGPDAYYLIVFGIGLGYHLEALAREGAPEFIVLVDQSLDFLCHSLEVFDWGQFIDSMLSRNRRIAFAIDPNPQTLSIMIANIVENWNPPSVDGTRVFMLDDWPVESQVMQALDVEMGKVLSFMGFFNDEIIMLRNTYNALGSGQAKVYRRPNNPKVDVPVFLVASGPSLDENIPFIRENQDKAVIISNGTALRSLLINGITPDIQIETENVLVYPLVALVGEKFDLSSICLIASTTVDSHILDFFGDVIFFFRSALSPYPLFCESERNCLLNPDPTVVNAGLSFAQETGFQDIYFFGVDLGTRGQGRHHSKDSYHYTENPIVVPEDLIFNIPVPGNFGGPFFSSMGFAFTLTNLVAAIGASGPGIRHFNCSDGALIEGAQPEKVSSLSFADIPGGKKQAVEKIIGGFPTYPKARFEKAWNEDRLFAAVNGFADRLIGAFEGLESFEDKSALVRATDFFRPLVDKTSLLQKRFDHTALQIFRGTCLLMMGTVEYFANRLSAPEHHRAFAKIVGEEIIVVAENLRKKAVEILSDPTVVPAITNEGAIEPEGVIPEVSASWGSVPRNAPCPCGSGKRYKQCHGSMT
ncbi:MAG: DUF115 domain-containing protein [Proteobacteria bacterium]|nr:DUF115 domain-containing protein [Pseudomonadota bacterium]